MTMKKYLYILIAFVLVACQQDEMMPMLTPEQQALIGRAVDFTPSMADCFITRATSYTSKDDGSFNQNDRMRIFRNYWNNQTNTWESQEAYRTYYLKYKYGEGNISLGTNWLPVSGAKGYDDIDGDGTYEPFIQKDVDSLTWDNGRTLRFRAWSLSNFHNALNNASKTYFYPDFCIADWVNASGPTQGIPLVLAHQGSRLAFKVLDGSGNTLRRVEICAGLEPGDAGYDEAWQDYKYADNADNTTNDNASGEAGKSDAEAKAEYDLVTSVYQRMCMPAGVDMARGTLKAVDTAAWNALTDAQVRKLEEQDESIFVRYGKKTPAEIKAVKRPFFCGINGSYYLITIPYDMSNDLSLQGEVLVLPPCTRFRVYIYDVNNGDEQGTGGYEGGYHIFTLSDIKDGAGNPAFPNGLKLEAGASHTFRVGYRYGYLTVVVDKQLSWIEQDESQSAGTDEAVTRPVSTSADYSWWKSAIHKACLDAESGSDYAPEFHISNEQEFLEFINLVNGTATTATSGLYRLVKTYKETNVGGQIVKEPKEYGWSTRNSQYSPQWIEEDEAEAMGYIFFDHYYPANADKKAYYDRDYLRGPFSFYDDNLRLNFRVVLDADIDLHDWSLESIGNALANPFMGHFNGNAHTLSNLNMQNEYLFGYINGNAPDGAAITNLKIESTHPTALLDTGINPTYIAGVSLHAPSTTNSIARSLTMAPGVRGVSYVVGCIHVGDAGGALVGTASSVNMFGCMQAARGITGGALVGSEQQDAAGNYLLRPQISLASQRSGQNLGLKPSFANFMCNYYDTTLSPSAKAVGTTTDDYSLCEYIRGRSTDILRAKNDYIIKDVPLSTLLAQNYALYYGLAPWKAMNYAIWWYNQYRGMAHPCTMHFEGSADSYKHQYPKLVAGRQTANDVKKWNPVEQPN